MTWDERDYYRDPAGGRFGGAGGVAQIGQLGFVYPRWGSISLWLILINCGMLLLDGIVTRIADGGAGLGVLASFFAFSVSTTFGQFRIWELITFQFQHAGIWHLIGNMIFVFFFGPMVESHFGSRRFLAFWLICGIGGVLGYLVLWGAGLFETTVATPLLGASAGVFGMMIAALFVAPNARVLLFFLIPIPLKAMVFIALFIALYVVLAGGDNPGGQAAHLGGALLGLILIKRAHWLDWADRGSLAEVRVGLEQRRAARARRRQQQQQQQVDRILDKVRDHGLHSLTRQEKRTLNRATERQRRAS